jgi:hypothetical protein
MKSIYFPTDNIMTDIFVSDLFGYNINNDTPFVIINSKELHKLLKKVAEDKYYIIWEYNRNKIDPILSARNVDPKRFLSSGHMVYYKNHKNDLETILLVNRSASRTPNAFDIKMKFSDGQIVTPVYRVRREVREEVIGEEVIGEEVIGEEERGEEERGEEDYVSLGSYYVKNGSQLDGHNIAVLPESMLLQTDTQKSLMTTDEFSLITSGRIINRSKLFNGDMRDMKLTSSASGKYLTMVDSEGNKKLARIKSKQNSERQTLSYNVQGELISDGKCLTYLDQNTPVFFDSCDTNNKHQKWNLENGKIKAHTEYDKCLAVGNSDSVYLKGCQDIDEQTWNTEDPDVGTSSDFGWDKYKGKNVVLVASDNPWYINKDDTYPVKYSDPESIRDDAKYRDNADFRSSIVVDPTRPNMGLGYSFLERANNGCKIEGFGDAGENRYVIMILFAIIFLVLVHKWVRY